MLQVQACSRTLTGKQKKQFPDITLLRNAGHYCELPDGRIESCLFGKYAVHLHTGTWRRGLRIK